jgi:AbiV family abortive infection protein
MGEWRELVSMNDNRTVSSSKHYSGGLTAVDAANAIRAARLNAFDLVDTAELLFTLKRFAHSVAFSIVAIEEGTKLAILKTIFLELDPNKDRSKLWQEYRNHRAKTTFLNPIIEGRIRAEFPDIPSNTAKKLGESGPTPNDLETT